MPCCVLCCAVLMLCAACPAGIPDYNTCRRALGLPAAKSFADITPDTNVQAILQDLYKDVNNIGEGAGRGGLGRCDAGGMICCAACVCRCCCSD
jgi:hypothetical protein